MAGFGLLGHLAGGYAQAAKEDRARQDAFDEKQRETQLGLSSMILQNPSVPPEYKGPVMEHAISIVNTPRGKKLPSWDKMMSSLPATNTPAKVSNVQQPELTLRPPSIPPGAPQASAAPTAGPSGDTSPAVGALSAPMMSNLGPGNANGIAPPAIPPGPMPTMTIPGATGTVTQAPQQVVPGGHFHIMSPEEIAQREQTIQMNKVMEIARQTGKTPAEIMGIKPQLEKLTPGEELRTPQGGLVAKNSSPKAGQIGLEAQFAPGGEFIGVKDHVTGQMLTGDDILKNPDARKVAQSALEAVAAKEKKTEDKEKRMAGYQAQQQARAFTQQVKMFEDREKAKEDLLSNTTKTMVESAPKVLDLSKRVRDLVTSQQGSLGPLAGRWNEYMTGKVGAPNPEFAKLRTDVSLLQTLLMRMHTGARGGQYIMQHFGDLINTGKQSPENLLATLDEIDQYANDVNATSRGVMDKKTVKPPAQPPGANSKPKNDPLGLFN